ncbi:MAG: hypothetical protein FJ303_27640 [Planctomycetes bacterium]|nr:hypothetical protein [Planctomycetota bacterium]
MFRLLGFLAFVLFAAIASAKPVRQKPGPQPEPVTIALKIALAAEVADVIKMVYRDAPDLTVAANPKTNSITIRAKAEIVRDVRELIKEIDRAADVRPAADVPKVIIWRGSMADPNEMNAILRIMKGLPTHDNTGKRIDDPPGPFIPGGGGGGFPVPHRGNPAGGVFLPGQPAH